MHMGICPAENNSVIQVKHAPKSYHKPLIMLYIMVFAGLPVDLPNSSQASHLLLCIPVLHSIQIL